MAGLGDRIWGGAQNAFANGKVYNSTTGQYAPGNVRWQRMVQGALGQAGPLGTIAGMIWGGITNKNPAAQRFDRGTQVAPSILPSGWRESHLQTPSMDIGPYQGGVTMPSMGQPGGLAGMVQQGGWQDQAYNNLNAQTNQRLADNEAAIGNQLSQRLAAAPVASNPRSSMAAGGHTIAEGAAAQQMFGDMRDAAQQSQMDAYQRQWKERYGGHMG